MKRDSSGPWRRGAPPRTSESESQLNAEVALSRLPIGVTLGTFGVTPGWWLDAARRLDEAGYRAIWSWDHFVSKGTEQTTPVLESWTMLSAAAGVTERVLLGTFVLNVMNRHPAVVAKAAATLQQASGGRFRLGIGIGGHPAEHEAYGIDFPDAPERVVHLRQAIAVVRALWTGGPVSIDAGHYRLRDAVAFPVPDAVPPILVGGQTRTGVRLAAELGDGWAAEMPSFEELAPRYLEMLAAAGKPRASQTVVVGLPRDKSGRPSLPGTAVVVEPGVAVAEWRERGADEIAVTAQTTEDVDALVDAAGRW